MATSSSVGRSRAPRKRRVRRTLSVRYFRLVDLSSGRSLVDVNRRAIDWEALIGRLPGGPIVSGSFTGRVYTHGTNRLVLSKPRDFAPRQAGPEGRVTPMRLSTEDHEPIEESFVSFIPGHNAFALARSGHGAPSAEAVANFLMGVEIPTRSQFLAVEPIVNQGRFERATRHVHLADWVAITARVPAADAPAEGLLAGFRNLSSTISEDIMIEIKVRSVEGRERTQVRQQLYREAQILAEEVERGDVQINDAQVKVPGEAGAIDLVKDSLTFVTSINVELKGRNRSLDEATAFDALDRLTEGRAAERLRQALSAF